MKKILLCIVVALMAASASAGEVQEYKNTVMKYRAWNRLCIEYAQDTFRSCAGVSAPKVVYEKMRDGLQGHYNGEDTVYVSRKLRGRKQEATLVHEMSHYLDTMLGLNPTMPVYTSNKPAVLKLCFSEKRAWDLTDRFNEDTGSRRRPVNGRWVNWYSHCRQFADKLYPDIYAAPLRAKRPPNFWRRHFKG
jgi:hypothetical protein